MLRCCCVLVLLCLSLVQSGFVGVHRDHVVEDDDAGNVAEDAFGENALESKVGFGDDPDLGRGIY